MSKKLVQLSSHLDGKAIFKVVFAPICMMIFTSFYSAVDGIFLSNVVGTDAFSGINLIWPYCMIYGGVGFMLGTGGSALVSKTLGEKDEEKASSIFSLIVYATIILGLIFAFVGYFTVEPFVKWMATLSSVNADKAVEFAIRYGHILMIGIPMYMLQNTFQSFFATAEKPGMGFLFVSLAGITNIILDTIFVVLLKMEVEGAAIATLVGYFIGGVLPLAYFYFKKDLNIHLGKSKFDGRALAHTFSNGSSEFVSNIASCFVSICYNAQLLIYAGPKGVSAYGIVMYVSFAFMAIFIGYSIGIAPYVGYNYGAKNNDELHNILKRSLIIIAIIGMSMFVISEVFGPYFCYAFAKHDAELLGYSYDSIHIYSFVFLTAGFSIFASSFFTALNNGLISAIISFVRSIVFEIVCIFVFPLLLGINGIWAAAPFAEIPSSIMVIYFFIKMRKQYRY